MVGVLGLALLLIQDALGMCPIARICRINGTPSAPRWEVMLYGAVIHSKLVYAVATAARRRLGWMRFSSEACGRFLSSDIRMWSVPPQMLVLWSWRAVTDSPKKGGIKASFKSQRLTLLGHVLRALPEDPMRRAGVRSSVASPEECGGSAADEFDHRMLHA